MLSGVDQGCGRSFVFPCWRDGHERQCDGSGVVYPRRRREAAQREVAARPGPREFHELCDDLRRAVAFTKQRAIDFRLAERTDDALEAMRELKKLQW